MQIFIIPKVVLISFLKNLSKYLIIDFAKKNIVIFAQYLILNEPVFYFVL